MFVQTLLANKEMTLSSIVWFFFFLWGGGGATTGADPGFSFGGAKDYNYARAHITIAKGRGSSQGFWLHCLAI